MAVDSILEITDGETAVNLLSLYAGFLLEDWTPAVATGKGGGVFQSSSLSAGRRLVHRVFGNALETFGLTVRDQGQDATIREAQQLVRLLESALAYWNEEDPRTVPVYIRARGPCETNTRYALIHYYEIPQLDNPYAQPFFAAGKLATMDNFTLNIERGHWTAEPPGGDTCAFISSRKAWSYGGFTVSHSDADIGTRFKEYIGKLFAAGAGGHIFEFDGATWSTSLDLGGAAVVVEMEVFQGALYAILNSGALYRLLSGAWSLVGTPFSAPTSIHAYDGALYVIDGEDIHRSTDGASWSVDLNAPGESLTVLEAHTPLENRQGLGLAPGTERLYALGNSNTLYTRKLASEGSGWNRNQGIRKPLGSASVSAGEMYGGSDNYLYLGGDTQEEVIIRSYNGFTWVEGFAVLRSSVANNPDIQSIVDDGDLFWAAADDTLWASKDGQIWTVYDNDSFTSINRRGLAVYQGKLYVMDAGATNILVKSDLDLGREETDECAPTQYGVYVANKSNIANLTHIKIDDGGSFTDIFPMAAFPVDLLPAAPAANDAIYFGISTAATLQNTGPFSSLVFDLLTHLEPGESIELVPEYWSGATWATLTVTDNSQAFGSVRLAIDGPVSVHWVPPSDWAATAVDGVTGWWVRYRVTSVTGTPDPPQQENRDIYSVVCPFVDIAADVIEGEIDALGRILVQNVSDLDGPGGSVPNLYENRVVVGVKEYDGESGGFFDAYLNASDTQNPVGVSVSPGTNTSFASDVATPTGRRAVYNPAGVESMADRVTFELSPTIARDFYGTYHLFLRGRRTGGSASDFEVQVEIATGSGGISFVTEKKQFQTTTAYEVLDFGQITIPASAFLSYKELGDLSEIRVQASAANAAVDLYIYDIILIPTGLNRFSCDAYDKTNSSTSEIGASGDNPKFLDLDSTTDPRNQVRALVKNLNQQTTAIYNPVTPHEVTLKANRAQKLWFLSMRTSATGTSYNWIAEPWITNTIQVYHNARYLTMRGDE